MSKLATRIAGLPFYLASDREFMTESVAPPRRAAARIAAVAFLLFAAVWTLLLLIPEPTKLLGLDNALPHAQPISGVPLDKVVHFTGYLILYVLAAAWRCGRNLDGPRGVIAAACIAHGALTEIIQTWVPSREGDVADWLADSLGVATGFAIEYAARRITAALRERSDPSIESRTS